MNNIAHLCILVSVSGYIITDRSKISPYESSVRVKHFPYNFRKCCGPVNYKKIIITKYGWVYTIAAKQF